MRLEHANISSIHTEELTRFIQTAFPDFRIRGEGAGMGGRPWRHVGNDDFYIAITTVAETSGRAPYSNSTGFNHLGWEVDDVAALEMRMKESGFTPNLKEHHHRARLRTYFYDPDGNDWEFVQYLSDDPAERNDYADD